MDTAALARAQEIAAAVIANVSSDQLGDATPCANWNVGQLVDHLVGAQHWASSALAGTEMTETGEGASEGDFGAAFNAAAAATLAAFNEDGALAKTVNPGFGDMPATALLGLAATDTFAHAWDLATATGQSNDLDADLAAQLLASARHAISDAFRSDDGAIFGPEQAAPADANEATKLAAFLGRSA
ncbi:MAG TPA: TIGR03086 family metal-binding protein [Microthrixaceae bacterium]|nr:TIGR03086 family protein [Microthrixaceae bacterium]HMS13312.1 TIGR03086 family metal-binding protein [Microthrixaceae bacterium]HMT24508.1 TIGR03086 family metal-binding protein [Microthrixaceae bacterium]HMT60637.1 TIGR03086 family metal-binding protein [Microthrixaceae bacterium]